MCSGGLKIYKNTLCGLFCIFLGVANFGDLKFHMIYTPFGASRSLIYIYHGIYQHHHLLPDPLAQVLPSDSPFSHLSGQLGMVSIHKLPRLIEKSLDHINQAHVKTFTCSPLCHIKLIFIYFSITLLAPSLVLHIIVSKYCKNKFNEPASRSPNII